MNILITTSRMPFALDEIRKLGRHGHRVIAADTFHAAPGNHSRYAAVSLLLPSPRHAPDAFAQQVKRTVHEHDIELIVPAFEEAIHLAQRADEVDFGAPLFAPDFETLLQLHNKARFQELARELGLLVPETVVVDNAEDLHAATALFPKFFARPAYSRGGVDLLTNTGPLANRARRDDLEPSPENPVLVQEFIEGEDLCTFSVCHNGRVAAHAAYVHPKEIEHAGGIVFESVEDEQALEAAMRIAEATGYHGQLSFDFMRTESGERYLIECNPRPTAGVIVMPDEMFVQALTDPQHGVIAIAPAGTRRKYSSALLRDMVVHPTCLLEDLGHLLSEAREVYFARDDLAPGVAQLFSYGKVIEYRQQLDKREADDTDLMAAYFHDVQYDAPCRSERAANDLDEPPPPSSFRPAA